MPRMFHELVGDPGDGVPLVLLHGMFASRRMWDLNRTALAARFPLVLVDLPGHGASPPLAASDEATPEALVSELERIREALGVARWCLCGQSFGAGVTLHYGLAHPERVAAQAFTNSRTTFRDAFGAQETELREGRIARIRAGGREAMGREVFHPRHAKRFPEPIKTVLSQEADGIEIETYLRLIGETAPALSLYGRDARPQRPTLLINGRHERAFQPCRDELAAAWPGMEIADIDGGHAVNIENPEGFDAALIGFLERQLG
ncbi:alpha/beta fold hydrolase [Oceanicola sp. 502str15]|uniref:alpha/beta fold hydrolase n=1 Tax=Oceanicola sp. 502str15 TaxID=2696061 RepID=UPI002095069C|nr:alpha/beta fold hydrolase [Oceanicola sp. 502str15]MCO6383046.1 alpha/beta fold hydrolase [Oceanicola sp. 502str15]